MDVKEVEACGDLVAVYRRVSEDKAQPDFKSGHFTCENCNAPPMGFKNYYYTLRVNGPERGMGVVFNFNDTSNTMRIEDPDSLVRFLTTQKGAYSFPVNLEKYSDTTIYVRLLDGTLGGDHGDELSHVPAIVDLEDFFHSGVLNANLVCPNTVGTYYLPRRVYDHRNWSSKSYLMNVRVHPQKVDRMTIKFESRFGVSNGDSSYERVKSKSSNTKKQKPGDYLSKIFTVQEDDGTIVHVFPWEGHLYELDLEADNGGIEWYIVNIIMMGYAPIYDDDPHGTVIIPNNPITIVAPVDPGAVMEWYWQPTEQFVLTEDEPHL